MKKILLVLALFFSCFVQAQNAEFTGTVRDEENKDQLSGATIKYDKTRGILTDGSGKFKVSLPAGEYEFTVTYIGYKNQKINLTLAAGEKKDMLILMKPTAIQINQIVAASQYKKNSAKETVTTEVISKNQIKNTNSNDLGEVVNKTPGVLVQDGQISIRGGSSYSYGVGSRTAILSDGLSLASADLGEGQSKMASVENVKQVEVIKGASSVVYGSSALNGVVNVVTEWPTDVDPKTEMEFNLGVYDDPKLKYQVWDKRAQPFFGILNLNHQRRIGKDVQLVAGGNVTGIKSYLEGGDEFRVRGFFKLRHLNPKIPGLNYGVNGTYMFEKSERFFFSKDLDSNAYVRGNGSTDKYMRTFIEPFVSYNHIKGHRVTSNWRYMNIFREGGGSDPDAISHQLITDNQYQYRYKGMLVVTAGIPFSVGFSSSNLYPGTRSNFNAAAYTQVEFNYKFLSLQGGIRYEVIGVDTVIVTGRPVFRSGVNIQAAKATFFRASWGQGYRIPSIGERFIAQEFFGGFLIIPNDTLRPENGWSLELGFKQGFKIGNWNAYVDGAFFWQQYSNFIEYQVGIFDNFYSNGQKIFPDSLELSILPGQAKLAGLKALNIENAKIAGYEIGIAGNGKIGPVGIQIMAGYTYTWPGQNTRDSSGKFNYSTGQFLRDMFKYNYQKVTDQVTIDRLLYYRSRHLFRADFEVSYWKCYLGATLNYGSIPERVPPLFQFASQALFGDDDALNNYIAGRQKGDYYMDIRSGIHINEKVKIGFIIKNVTNRYYSLRPGRAEPLRNYTLQFRYIF
jgi:iron complex outermembrane receptor protein